MRNILVAVISLLLYNVAKAEIENPYAPLDSVAAKKVDDKKKQWYESIKISGYVQERYNRLLETNPDLKCEQCDKSWGQGGSLFLRRARIKLSGYVHPQVYFYFQTDVAQAVGSNWHFAQMRDAYFDLGLDKLNEHRIRFGESKVPFGFENMQSSQHRIPIDRVDALNSGAPNERDLGVFYMWAPKSRRTMFSDLTKHNLKGSGDYGCFAFGVYNGQSANKPDLNNQLHVVGRMTYPFNFKGQTFDPGVQVYTGNFVIPTDQTSTGVKISKSRSYLDQRFAGTFVMYPKPFGLFAEYNIGTSPQYNKATDSIENKNLKGGYITVCYLPSNKKLPFMAYARAQNYKGGKKHELDARSYDIKELELGIEWHINSAFELVTAYVFSERRFEDHVLQNNNQKGRLLRLQAQLNF